jgi:hypothetical protein
VEEPGLKGSIIVFQVKEKRGLTESSMSASRLIRKPTSTQASRKKISLSKDTKYDPTIVSRAVALIKTLLADKAPGRHCKFQLKGN